MPEDLTKDQTALLCDLGEWDPAKASDAQKQDLETLVHEGFVERGYGAKGLAFKLTAKGVEYLGERGAGLNEA